MVNFIGRIVNKNNEPIDGARVSFNFQGNIYVAYTDSEGKYRFSIHLLNSGTFNGDIKVEADDYKIYSRFIEISSINPQIEEFRLTNTHESAPSIQIQVAHISRQALIIVAIIGLLGTLITLFVQFILPKKQDDRNKSTAQSNIDTNINKPNTNLSLAPTIKPNNFTISPSPSPIAMPSLKPNINKKQCIGVIPIFYKKIYTQHINLKSIGNLDLPTDGVAIKDVFEGFPAAKAHLQAGDMIITVNNESITSSLDFQKKIQSSILFVNLKVIRPSFYSFNINNTGSNYSSKPPYKEYEVVIIPEYDCKN